MGKSSLKKKGSKNSSQSRTRKRIKDKSRKSKSKKLRHRRDYCEDSDSSSMVSVSSSSSEDDYSSRSRSRNRKDVKGGKKRARRRSSSRETSEVSLLVRKRKGPRRDDDYGTKKRTGKKKSRRDASVSSSGSGSRSSSTFQSSSDEVEYEKRRGRFNRKEKGGRRSEKVKRGSKTSRDRSRSFSSCSRYSEDSDDPTEERVMEESNSRRLKSVITVIKQENESSGELKDDEPKEDVYDYDDYPSCRSNDSNDGCSRRELPPKNSHVVSGANKPLDDDEQGEVSNIRTCSAEESGKDGKPRCDGYGKNDTLGESDKVLSSTGGLNADDMESILRQRALENLRKFREGRQTNINVPLTRNDKNDCDLGTPSSVNTDPFQIETPQGDDARVVIASQVKQQNRKPPVREDSATLPKNDSKASHLNGDYKYSRTLGSDVAPPPAQVVPAGVPRVEVSTSINSVSNKPKLAIGRAKRKAPNTDINKKQTAAEESSQANLITKSSVNEGGLETTSTVKPPKETAASVSNRPRLIKPHVRLESPNIYTAPKQESAALESSRAKLVRESSMNGGDLGTAQTPPECAINNGMEVDNALGSASVKPSSSSMSTLGDVRSDKPEDEAIDGSQFQQKSMSVMRGGEMVQVSYQVYIPKRAPGLARRQLKR